MTLPLQVSFGVAGCSVHRIHLPRPVMAELHHVFPLYLQHRVWPGVDPQRESTARDKRKVPICPTGHSDVHVAIAALLIPGAKIPKGVGRGELALARDAIAALDAAVGPR